MTVETLLYEGKAKKVYATDKADVVKVSYKDDATAFNGVKRGQIVGKGAINNQMSNLLFAYLSENGVPTHLIEQISERETLVKKVDIVPIEVVVRNLAAGSFSKRLGVPESTPLPRPIVEFYLKDDELGDPLITDDHALALNLATASELDALRAQALRINELLQAKFAACQLILVDFKLEFGKTSDGDIVLADEISPDTCRLWDMETRKKLDKDRFRQDLGNVEDAYQEVYARITAIS
ncbi:phosphoribosylaminoimidazolesuccinocarboxamide synthase [Alicyclobacillus acidoterrestris]|uniref:Phosphoribosylaminoimidazole-succinocarboxamide synthase n=1 Tax=Alicyclobacillus acidoterrestris (strain ATCC 49025 / DSM 3922 / CIP 106132 / NCIMB 13137 / GD3B) TaxID=1356854 RepID=T0BK49_ALIAG|nr:phosphoribosylaminoimidazolesuccinocarboxamide synthase [Alicyclobacillus acidoterrestris]EPZ40950.1 phosphoribosylaminoimidazole-succinocarboxamide synthase [Alicyclobacillus acidoterrestris ATCC 49025]UNO49726.1 phosphoribosylaminoimidazolesuccinocarboxamide synthase [Alicyclobacillus acidoterrestris]